MLISSDWKSQINEIIENSCTKIQTNNFVYIIDNLTPSSEYITWGVPCISSEDSTQSYPTYRVWDVNTFRLNFRQDNTNIPTVEIRLGDDVIYTFSYTLSNSFGAYKNHYFDSKQAYWSEATFNFPTIGELNTNNKEGDLKLWVEQNGIYQEVLTFPTHKKITAITKPNENYGFTFAAFRESIYPIGGIYISTNNINPGTFIGGTWETITSPITDSYAWKRTA